MARSKKRSRQKQAKAQSPEAIAHAAAEALQSGRFKDAVDDYKRLLKQQQRSEWVSGLAQAYAGRAEHLASRGMIKEAIALWHNRAETCGEPLADPRYLSWLVAADRSQEIVRLYGQDPEALAGKNGLAALAARLAALALADGGALIAQLPADDPVARDFPAADAALKAYADNDDSGLDAALARIPFRSPYRDFRQLLKAALRREHAPEAAAELLARVPADSPFVGLRAALNTAGLIDSGSVPELADHSAEVVTVVAALVGWSREQRHLIVPLARLGPSPDHQALFEFVVAHRSALGARFARDAAFALAGDDQAMHRRLVKIHSHLSQLERMRLLAQVVEAHDPPWDAVDAWQEFLDRLALEPKDDDNRLRQALVHRHIAGLIQSPQMGPPLAPGVIDHLAASLEHDPADREPYLRLITHYLHVRDLKSARHWVDRALQQFPEDIEALYQAAQTAMTGGAYRKAAGFARRILTVDPINARGQGLLVDAHLGHARKQIKANKPEIATRELNDAEQAARTGLDQGRVAILRSLMTFSKSGAQAAGETLTAGITRIGGGLVGRFFLLLEAGRLNQDLNAVTRAAQLPAAKTLGDREQVLALAHTLGTIRETQIHQPSAEAALKQLAPAINRVARADFERADVELICETLLRYRQYDVLKRYANAALRRWSGAPLFVFYWAAARLAGRRPRPWENEIRHLESARERAEAAGDQRTAQRIDATLEAAFPEPRAAQDMGPAVDALLEMILGSEEFERLQDAVKNGQPPPPDIAAKLEQVFGDDGEAAKAEPKKRTKPKKAGRKQTQADASHDDLFGDGP